MLSDRVKDFIQCGVAVAPVADWRFYGKANKFLNSLISSIFIAQRSTASICKTLEYIIAMRKRLKNKTSFFFDLKVKYKGKRSLFST